MPDYRLIHRRALRGEKVGLLTDFERGVWLAYLLIADDYGVMPFDAGELARAVWLKGKPQKTIQKALERVRDVGLIQTWTHQGAPYCYACDWQEWQNVRHPRGTIEPCPPAEILSRCKPKTRELFAAHSRNNAEEPPQDDGEVSEELRNLPRLARAGGRETLTLTQTLPANANTNAKTPVASTLHRGGHQRHSWCSERICVPDFTHERLTRQLGRPDASAWLFDWYQRVLDRIGDAPIGDKPEDFWPRQFAAEFPPEAGKSKLTAALEKAGQW